MQAVTMTIFDLAGMEAGGEGLPMADEREGAHGEFAGLVLAVVERGLRQTGQPPLASDEAEVLVAALRAFGEAGGWAVRFGGGREELPAERVAQGVGQVLRALPGRSAEFAGLAKQVFKACFQPPPPVCRDSYREGDATGRCRRQERTYDLARVSGAHCVDCPYWEEFSAGPHLGWLSERWRAGRADLEASAEVFLPEDFRELRRWRPASQPGE
jgi:hypothetical protein